jgi:hypothetical protein
MCVSHRRQHDRFAEDGSMTKAFSFATVGCWWKGIEEAQKPD